METGPSQHYVPQQMIRRFANERNQLRALRKSTLTIGKRPKGPKKILCKDNYYKDNCRDLDAEWLTPIEQQFAKYYPKLADEPWQTMPASKEEGEAFIDWTISQLCRTPLLPALTDSIMRNKPLLFQAEYAKNPTLFHNMFRRVLFENLKEVYTLPGWKWKVSSTVANLVLSDHPVCSTPSNSPLGHVIFVPLSKKRIIFGGGMDSIKQVEALSVRNMNCILASRAEEWIYAADDATLLEVVHDLKGEGSTRDGVCLTEARKPFFGLPERAASAPQPNSSDIFEEMKRHYKQAVAESQ